MKKINSRMGALKKGFTLIELMVVVAIIAILSGILLANFAGARANSRDGQRISDMAQLQLALAGYFNQCNDYPKSDSGLIDATVLTESDANCPSGVTLSTFISKIPTPPPQKGQTSYIYLTAPASGTVNDYMLEATLEGNSTVSSESLSSVPNDIKTANGGSSNYTCQGVYYCLGPK